MSDTPLTDAVLAKLWDAPPTAGGQLVQLTRHGQKMERDRAELLEVLTVIAGGPVQRVSQDLHNRARAAIAKATGDSHE